MTTELIEKWNSGVDISKLARHYKVSRKQITNKLIAAGVYEMDLSHVDIPEILEEYKSGISKKVLMPKYHINSSTFNYILSLNDITKRNLEVSHRVYTMNYSYFKTIDTHAKAYWLGWLYSDGYIRKSSNTVQLSLQNRDIEVLLAFRVALSATHPIKYNTQNSKYFRVRAKEMVDDLYKLGCYQAKSLTLTFPTREQVSEEFLNSFMLGHFDGDGSISGNHFSVIGARKFIESYQQELMSHCQLNQTKLTHTPNNIATLHYGGRVQVRRIAAFLLKDYKFSLKRKRDRLTIL